jgi:hypothetical protein
MQLCICQARSRTPWERMKGEAMSACSVTVRWDYAPSVESAGKKMLGCDLAPIRRGYIPAVWANAEIISAFSGVAASMCLDHLRAVRWRQTRHCQQWHWLSKGITVLAVGEERARDNFSMWFCSHLKGSRTSWVRTNSDSVYVLSFQWAHTISEMISQLRSLC